MLGNVLFIYLWNSMTALQKIKEEQKYIFQKEKSTSILVLQGKLKDIMKVIKYIIE